ncbi:MAG: POTRA domain-containing protein [Bacteroidota bacterium]
MTYKRYLIFITFLLLYSTAIKGQSLLLEAAGETSSSNTVIDSLGYKKQFTDYKSLETEVYSLKDRLQRSGYIDTYIESIKKENDSLFKAEFFIGDRVPTIRVYYGEDFNTEFIKLVDSQLGEGYFDLDIEAVENALNTINRKIAEFGDPFSTLQLINLKKETNQLISADLNIKTNQKRTIDKILVKGYEKFPKSYIKRFLKLEPGNTFNLEEIKDQTRLLENLRFASQIKDPEVLFTQDSTVLYLYLEKRRSNNFDGFLGFGTNENTNRIEFDGYLNLQLINNLNFGESLSILYKSDEIDQQTFDIKTTMPFLFGSPVALDLGLNIFRKDSTFVTTQQNAKIAYQINAKHRIAAGVNVINSSNLLDENTAVLNDYDSNYYLLNYNYIEPQYYDPLFPINFLFDLTASTGRRENDEASLDQNAFNLNTFKIFNLNERNSIYTRLNGARLISDEYFDNELYRFGGINSIRGFEENSLVGNLFAVLNTEYRYRLSNSIYVHSVLDAAYTENQLSDTKTKLFGFGFGFGLLTKAGLFKFNYSSGKTEGRQFRLADSKIHVSLTATF